MQLPVVSNGCREESHDECYAGGPNNEQAIIIHLRFSDSEGGTREEQEKMFALEDKIITAIDHSEAGVYDGNEIGGGEFTIYIYGRSAERLWDIVSPLMKTLHARNGSYLIMRDGGPGASEKRVPLADVSDSFAN